jgi:acyl-CoA synthetase (NDP forming)
MKFAIKRNEAGRAEIPEPLISKRPGVKNIFEKARKEQRANLLETESRDILKKCGLSLPHAIFTSNMDDVKGAAHRLSYPVAMKVVCPDIIHKSDVGGLKLDLKDEMELCLAFEEILASACTLTRRERVLGTLISPMAPEGQECIVGMIRDPQFGPVIMFGLGGIFVEAIKDVSFRVAPPTDQDIDEMIQEIKGYKLLTGTRGGKPKDTEAIKQILAGISQIAVDNPEIKEIDLNPVIVHEKGASIVDSRIILS